MAPRDPLAELEANLAAQIPGLRLLDRELELDSKRGVSGRIDFAGTDGDGRMVLVALVEEDGDSAALAALDLAALAKRHGALLARHLDLGTEASIQPRLVLVAERYDDLLLARLGAFGELFELLAIETLRSERGARTYLVPTHGDPRQAASFPSPVTRSDFLESLAERHRVPAELLSTRLERMDSEVHATYSSTGVRWSFRGNDFLGTSSDGESLVGFVLPGGEDVTLDSVDGVEKLVEAAFGAYVRLMSMVDMTAEPETDFHDVAVATEIDLTNGPLLTEDEIAAFQS